MLRITMIFDTEFTWRSYYESGVIQKLSNDHKIRIIFININPKVKINNFEYIKTNKLIRFLLTINSFSYWTANQNSSQSFQIRIKSIVKGRRLFFEINKGRSNRSISSLIGILLGTLKLRLPISLCFMSAFNLNRRLNYKSQDCYIYPTTGGPLTLADYLTHFCNRVEKKLIICIDNWDNIFSKAVFHLKPKSILVWGPQAANFAQKVHKIPERNIIEAGAPRIEYTLNNLKDMSQEKDSEILFAGGSFDFRTEMLWLENIANSFSTKETLIYLPHPINYRFAIPNNEKIRKMGIEMIKPDVLSNINRNKLLPSLNLYHKILQEVRVVVSPLSTLSLEALVYGKISIGIDFAERLTLNKQSRTWWASESYEHYFGLMDHPNFILVKTHKELNNINFKSLNAIKSAKTNYFYNPTGFISSLSHGITND